MGTVMEWQCPHCRQKLQVGSLDDLPHLPFCSERCRMADLHGWLTDRYVISGRADEADLGETSAADLAPPPDEKHKKKPDAGDRPEAGD